jgi:hypothetical protein
MSRELLRALTAEAIGTFALVFAGCGRAGDHVRDLRRGPHQRRPFQRGCDLRVRADATLPVAARVRLLGGAVRRRRLRRCVAARVAWEHRARRRDLPVGVRGAGVSLGAGDECLLDVRDPGRRHRHARGGGGRGDRDRRHDRLGRDVRRTDHRRVDESDAFARTSLVSGDLHAIWVCILAPIVGASIGGITYQFVRGEQTRLAELQANADQTEQAA